MIQTAYSYVVSRCRQLLDDNGLKEWKPVIDEHAKSRAGQCRYAPKEIGITRFWISMVKDRRTFRSDVDNLLLHEIAHATAPPNSNHCLPWQREYTRLLRRRFSDRKAKQYIAACSYRKVAKNASRLIKEARAADHKTTGHPVWQEGSIEPVAVEI